MDDQVGKRRSSPGHRQTQPKYGFLKLTQTSALRLYRVPRTSQLPAWLSPDRDVSVQSGPHSGNRGVVTHTPGTRSGRPQLCPTALEALGTRVPPNGPRADVLAIPPWEVPNWGWQLALMGVTNPQDCRRFVEDLYQSPAYSNVSIIHVVGTISNKDWPENQLVGGAAVILTEQGQVCSTGGPGDRQPS